MAGKYDDAILRVLRDAAAKGAPCPTNRAIAEAVGMSADACPCALSRMHDRGDIRIEYRTSKSSPRRIHLPDFSVTGWTVAAKSVTRVGQKPRQRVSRSRTVIIDASPRVEPSAPRLLRGWHPDYPASAAMKRLGMG